MSVKVETEYLQTIENKTFKITKIEEEFNDNGFLENNLVILTKQTIDNFLREDNPADLIALYTFYYYTAKWQKTNQAYSTDGYTQKGLHWGYEKFIKTKKKLLEFGLIEQIINRREDGKIEGYYIKVNYIFKKKTVERLVHSKQGTGKQSTNALSTININAYRELANEISELSNSKISDLEKKEQDKVVVMESCPEDIKDNILISDLEGEAENIPYICNEFNMGVKRLEESRKKEENMVKKKIELKELKEKLNDERDGGEESDIIKIQFINFYNYFERTLTIHNFLINCYLLDIFLCNIMNFWTKIKNKQRKKENKEELVVKQFKDFYEENREDKDFSNFICQQLENIWWKKININENKDDKQLELFRLIKKGFEITSENQKKEEIYYTGEFEEIMKLEDYPKENKLINFFNYIIFIFKKSPDKIGMYNILYNTFHVKDRIVNIYYSNFKKFYKENIK